MMYNNERRSQNRQYTCAHRAPLPPLGFLFSSAVGTSVGLHTPARIASSTELPGTATVADVDVAVSVLALVGAGVAKRTSGAGGLAWGDSYSVGLFSVCLAGGSGDGSGKCEDRECE
ncbi:hypothetical protein MCOR25_004443 [Pyricularia grisea]|nr:hypothetical protein MCOR25_004443 [Pyricularia grisea]